MLERALIDHGSPTLANMKVGSLFTSSCADAAGFRAEFQRVQAALESRGVSLTILRVQQERALVYEDAPDAFDAIFRHVIALGKCIEVNTSGYAMTGDTFAHSSLIRRYIELGGENFTFGSDSHDTARDYADVERAKEMVRALGGKYQVSFEGRKAIYWKI